MKDKRNIAIFVIGLILIIISIFKFDYIKKYQDIIIPLVIAIGFASFIYFLADILHHRHEVFRLKYKAIEDANFHLNDFEKELKIQSLIMGNFPYIDALTYESFKIFWTHTERVLDSVYKLNASFIKLKGLFLSQEVKKYILRVEKKLKKLSKQFEDFAKMGEAELKEAINDIKNFGNMMREKSKKQDKICADVEKEFFNLQNAIFKEMKIPLKR